MGTIIVSIVPNLLLIPLPISWVAQSSTSTPNSSKILRMMPLLLCFAAGGLLGDVFLHILPHLMLPHDHNHSSHEHDHEHDHEHEHEHDHEQQHNPLAFNHMGRQLHGHEETGEEHGHSEQLVIGLTVLFGFLFFMFAERLAQNYHSHSQRVLKKSDQPHQHSGGGASESSINGGAGSNSSGNNSNRALLNLGIFGRISSTGLLNLLADSLHNFTDGLAIAAASFATSHDKPLSSQVLLITTILSVLFHEIPHEIGDFAILVQSGMRFWK